MFPGTLWAAAPGHLPAPGDTLFPHGGISGAGPLLEGRAAAEVIGLPKGSVGERLYTAKVYFQTPDLFAWTAVIVGVSVVFERLFLWGVDALVRKAGAGWK